MEGPPRLPDNLKGLSRWQVAAAPTCEEDVWGRCEAVRIGLRVATLGLDDAAVTDVTVVSSGSKRSPLHVDDFDDTLQLRPWDRLTLAAKAPSDDWPLPYEVQVKFHDGEGEHELTAQVGSQESS